MAAFEIASWEGRRVLVTGGAGFVGSHVVERLLALGARVTAADKDPRRCELWLRSLSPHVQIVVGDLSESARADEATRDQEVVFHLASKMAGLKYNAAHPAEMLVDNTLLDLQLLRWSVRNSVSRVLFCSGALVYDTDRPYPTPEDAGTGGPANADCEGSVWAKRIGERAVRYYIEESGLDAVIARLANVFGPRDDFQPETAHLIGSVIRTASSGGIPEIHGDGNQTRSYLYVTDAADALVRLAASAPPGEIVNVCGRTEVSVRDVIETILEQLKLPHTPLPRAAPTGAERRLLDTAKFHRLTGFKETVSFAEGIRRTIAWYQAHRASIF